MKKLSLLLVVGLLGLSSMAVSAKEDEAVRVVATNQAETAHYDVVKREKNTIKIDGKLDDKVWETVPSISGSFHYPWEAVEAPYTEFKAYHDNKNFYFSFAVKDEQVLVDEKWNDDERSTVDNEDRVELFFAAGDIDVPQGGKLQPYYNVEVDAKGRVHDYSMVYYRDYMDSTWDMEGLKSAGQTTEDGYVVEAYIPLKTLNDLKLINEDHVMRTGVYRAEFSKPEKAEEITMQWISWVDPKTAEPDYHVNSSFGEFRFLQ